MARRARACIALAFVVALVSGDDAPSSFLADVTRRTALSMCEMEPRVGAVEDCRCDFSVVDAATNEFFGPLLADLTQRTFFRYFKVDLDRACPFWSGEGTCARRECAVEECAEAEVPAPWLEEDRNRSAWAAWMGQRRRW